VIRDIGYVDPTFGFAADTCQVDCRIHASHSTSARRDGGEPADMALCSGSLATKPHH